jgi:hypothetical protein
LVFWIVIGVVLVQLASPNFSLCGDRDFHHIYNVSPTLIGILRGALMVWRLAPLKILSLNTEEERSGMILKKRSLLDW